MAEDKHDAEHALSDSDTTTDEQQVLAQTSEAEEKRLLRKLDLRLLPAVSILYLLSFLDRSNGISSPPSTTLSHHFPPSPFPRSRSEGIGLRAKADGNN